MKNSQDHFLHGLVVFNSLRKMKTGATRSLRLAETPLGSLGIQLHYVASRSILHFFPGFMQNKRFHFDFVIFNGLASIGPQSYFSYRLWRIARFFSIPIFFYWHETDWVFDQLKKNPHHYNRVANISRHSSGFHLTASKACSASITKNFDIPNPVEAYECSVVSTFVDPSRLPSNPPIVINLASIQERKGTDLFVETAIQVCKLHPSVKFIWLGDGQPYGNWHRKIKTVGFENRIIFPGYDNNPHQFLQKASVFFLSSRDDPFPLSLLEAMALGRTVVAFDIGGIPEALGDAGCLIPAFNTISAAKKIYEILQKPPIERINYDLQRRYQKYYTPEKFAFRLNSTIRESIFNS